MLATAFLVALFLTDTLKYFDVLTLALTFGAFTIVFALAILIDDEVFTVYCDPNASEVNRISGAFADNGYTVISAEVEMIPQNYVTLNEHQRETFEKMLAKLDESDDVQEVIHNLEED